MSDSLQKVTCFITREANEQQQLLLIQHPTAGIQIPAGTVEPGEPVQAAAMREINEETGLEHLGFRKYLGKQEEKPPEGYRFIGERTKVFSKPDRTSFDWAHLQLGVMVKVERVSGNFTQVSFIEYDQFENPSYITYQITGWVPTHLLEEKQCRFCCWFACREETEESWQVYADNHRFILFWAPVDDLPKIISPQDEWIAFFLAGLAD